MPDERVLLELGWKYLTEDGQIVMEILLCRGGVENFKYVQAGILGAIDKAQFANKISSEQAMKDCLLLGLDPIIIHDLRQKNRNWN